MTSKLGFKTRNRERKVSRKIAEANDLEEDIEDLYEWIQDEDNTTGCAVLFLKNHGELNSQFKLLRSDFCLIVATNNRKFLSERGIRTLCVDQIPWQKSDELCITVLFVVDSFGVEHTVAFMLSDRNDAYIYEVLFTKLKKYLDDAEPEMMLTPISQSVFNAFKNITKNEVTRGAFAPWQVDESWRNQLKIIKKSDKRKEVYKILRGLQMESDRSEFEELYTKLLEDIKSDSFTKQFYKIWIKSFHKTLNFWASCFRGEHIPHNDIHSLHGLYESLKFAIAKVDKNVLGCTQNLVRALKDKNSNKTVELSGNELLKKEIIIKSMHTMSKDEEYQFEEKSDCWLLECDKSQMIYEIRKLQPSSCCEVKCSECDICYHTYTCTCTDYLVKNTICKHIHFIHTVYESAEDSMNGVTTDQSNQNAEKLKKELITMTASIVNRLDDINDEDVLCTLRSQLQNSLMLLTYFSEENGSAETIDTKCLKNGTDGLKRKNFEEIDRIIKKNLKG